MRLIQMSGGTDSLPMDIVKVPCVGAHWPASNLSVVLFPDPLAPATKTCPLNSHDASSQIIFLPARSDNLLAWNLARLECMWLKMVPG